jgi:uncharacterized protein YcaQ
MLTLKWSQVNAWRLAQHQLLERAEPGQLLEVVTRIGGVQAQLMSAAELALWARVQDLPAQAVSDALWRDRSLIKTWAMRGTLHLLTAREFPVYVAARAAHTIHRPPSWFKYHGVTPAELEAILDGVRATLKGSPLTREQLADAIAKRARKPRLREALRSGWGAVLKPSAFQGDVCFGPNRGPNVTFVRPSAWIGAWQPVEPGQAMQELARRYLTAYGPATVDDFAHWWGFDPGKARPVFRSLGDEVEAVEVDGWKAWALASRLQAMRRLKAPRSVRLLPNFDPYVIAVARHFQHILDARHKARVYRPQGWISPVVLIDGRMEGVWEYDRQDARAVVTVDMFAPPTATVRRGLQAEVERLAGFWDVEVELKYGG